MGHVMGALFTPKHWPSRWKNDHRNRASEGRAQRPARRSADGHLPPADRRPGCTCPPPHGLPVLPTCSSQGSLVTRDDRCRPTPTLSGMLAAVKYIGLCAYWCRTRVAAFLNGMRWEPHCEEWASSASILSEVLFTSWHLGVAGWACLCILMIWSYTKELLAVFYGWVGVRVFPKTKSPV